MSSKRMTEPQYVHDNWEKAVTKTGYILKNRPENEIPNAILDEAILPFTRVYPATDQNSVFIMAFDPNQMNRFGTKTTAKIMSEYLIRSTPRAHECKNPNEEMIIELSERVERALQNRFKNTYNTDTEVSYLSASVSRSFTMPLSNGIYDTKTSKLHLYSQLPDNILPPDNKVSVMYDPEKHAPETSLEIYYILRNLLHDNQDEAKELFYELSKGAHDKGEEFLHDFNRAVWNAVCDAQIHEPCRGCDGLDDTDLCFDCSRRPGLVDNFRAKPKAEQ